MTWLDFVLLWFICPFKSERVCAGLLVGNGDCLYSRHTWSDTAVIGETDLSPVGQRQSSSLRSLLETPDLAVESQHHDYMTADCADVFEKWI